MQFSDVGNERRELEESVFFQSMQIASTNVGPDLRVSSHAMTERRNHVERTTTTHCCGEHVMLEPCIACCGINGCHRERIDDEITKDPS
jgi:hypothetical protein